MEDQGDGRKMNNEWQFKMHYHPGLIGHLLYMYRVLPYGEKEFVTWEGKRVIVKDKIVKDDLWLAHIENLESLKSLIDQADSIGIRPDSNARLEGELEATKKHLFDMRAIAYMHEGLMFEADVKERPKK